MTASFFDPPKAGTMENVEPFLDYKSKSVAFVTSQLISHVPTGNRMTS